MQVIQTSDTVSFCERSRGLFNRTLLVLLTAFSAALGLGITVASAVLACLSHAL
jgi:F0F1-type ATP synthase membrane subunit c/vacuolar-type H+-ATPase subunit K